MNLDDIMVLGIWSEIPGFIHHISPALVGVLFGALGVQYFFISRQNKAQWINEISEMIRLLEKASHSYWICEKPNDLECKRYAQQIKSLNHSIQSETKSLFRKCKTRVSFQEEVDNLLIALIDGTTGGQFESANRKSDPARALKVSRSCCGLICKLKSLKL